MTDARTSDPTTRLADLVGATPVAMVTTVDATGALNARPLTVKRIDDDGAVWFLVDANAEWVTDRIQSVNLAFQDDTTWVSASGSAELVVDPAVIDELGDPTSDAWFEEGSTPVALRVEVGRADYWDGPGQLVMLLYFGNVPLTASRPGIGGRATVAS